MTKESEVSSYRGVKNESGGCGSELKSNFSSSKPPNNKNSKISSVSFSPKNSRGGAERENKLEIPSTNNQLTGNILTTKSSSLISNLNKQKSERRTKNNVVSGGSPTTENSTHSNGAEHFNESNSNVNNSSNRTQNKCCLCWCCCCSCSCSALRNNEENNRSKSKDPDSDLNCDVEETPSLEEVRGWGESFDRLMRSVSGRKFFREFLKCEYSEENILFWLACEELKKESKPELIEEKARLIYEDYISILSPKEVSLDSRVREIVNQNMVNPCCSTFDEAQIQIYTLMHRDSYPRFVNSLMYKKLAQLNVQHRGSTVSTSALVLPPSTPASRKESLAA